jgi:hypothetical protein
MLAEIVPAYFIACVMAVKAVRAGLTNTQLMKAII